MEAREVILGDKVIAPEAPVFVMAAIGAAEGVDLSRASRLIDAAVQCGVDAVSFRSGDGEAGGALRDNNSCGPPAGERNAGQTLEWEGQVRLKQHADAQGIFFLAAPANEESVDSLDRIGVPAFSVLSGDLTHIPLLRHIASKRKPVFLATGMSYLNEVADAVWALRSGGAGAIILMHTVAGDRPDPESLNLLSMRTLYDHFRLPVGYSDAGEGILYALAAASMGAVAIEKRLVLASDGYAKEDPAAATPQELNLLVRNLQRIKIGLGDGRKRPMETEGPARIMERRSIVAAVDIRAYERVAPWMLDCRRPGTGLAPGKIDMLTGMLARRDIARGSILHWDDLGYAPREEEGKGARRTAPGEMADAVIGKAGEAPR